jgi:hypothetical protein
MTKNSKKVTFSFFSSIKFAVFLLFTFFYFDIYSQVENLSPVYQIGSEKVYKRGNNEPFFYYITDTLSLPIIDDFSRNHFQRYSKDTLGQNIIKKRFYKYLGSDNQKIDLKKYASDLPRKIIYIPQKKVDSIVLINISYTKIKIADFSAYPVFYNEKKVYLNYTVYDTLEPNNSSDTIWYKNQEFFQDSLVVFESKLHDKNAYWLDSNVYLNSHYPINPWTLGVATFDGLKSDGYPYFINSGIRGYGDYLTSKPINLDGLTLKDSIYFSFLYQPKGLGDAPENINVGSTSKHDSLCLQFYNPTYNKWFSVWSKTVSEIPEIQNKEFVSFKKVHLKVKDSTFLKNNFQFRFVNYGDLSGSLDHFHLDYIKFRKNSGYQDTLFKDFAFIYPVNSILKKYTSIPWKHFVNAAKKPISDSISFFIRNGSNIAENNDQTNYLRLYNKGIKFNEFEILGQKLTNGQINYSEFTNYLSYHNFSDKITIPINYEDSSSIIITAKIKSSYTNLPENDSSEYKQKFADYYAYDDGSAEAAYGLKSSQASVAYKFSTLTSDSLLGAYMFFSPSVNDKSKKQFALTVWRDNNGIPGEILYEDDDFSLHNPIYGDSRDQFMPYYFKEFQRVLVDTSFFIGFRQIDKEYLNIGFDRNTRNISKIFYSMDKINWNKSQVDSIGSLMIRPIFVSNLNKKVFVNHLDEGLGFVVFPNPANELLYIKSNENEFKITDIQGRQIISFMNNQNGMDISSISSGVYFVTAIKSGLSQKLVIE